MLSIQENIWKRFLSILAAKNTAHLKSDSRYLRPDSNELLSMLEDCEQILSDIRPNYPSRSDKIFHHLRLRHFLSECVDARKRAGRIGAQF